FRDWVVFQRESRHPAWDGQRRYWAEQLAGMSLLDLPTDRTRGGAERFDGARLPIEIGGPLTVRLKELARHHEASLFALLVAAFQTLLHRYTGQSDVAVGS